MQIDSTRGGGRRPDGGGVLGKLHSARPMPPAPRPLLSAPCCCPLLRFAQGLSHCLLRTPCILPSILVPRGRRVRSAAGQGRAGQEGYAGREGREAGTDERISKDWKGKWEGYRDAGWRKVWAICFIIWILIKEKKRYYLPDFYFSSHEEMIKYEHTHQPASIFIPAIQPTLPQLPPLLSVVWRGEEEGLKGGVI